MGKIKGNGHGKSDWGKMREDDSIKEWLSGILEIKTTDEKGHYERQNVKFQPATIQKLSMILSKKVRPEVRTIHDLIRGYVEIMANFDCMEEGKNESELTQTVREMLKINIKLREENAILSVIEKEIESAFLENPNIELQKSTSKMVEKLPLRLQAKIRRFMKNLKKSFFEGKNQKILALAKMKLHEDEGEEIGDDEDNVCQ